MPVQLQTLRSLVNAIGLDIKTKLVYGDDVLCFTRLGNHRRNMTAMHITNKDPSLHHIDAYQYFWRYDKASMTSTVVDLLFNKVNLFKAIDVLSCLGQIIQNPYFGCSSLEEALVRRDLIA